MRSECYEIFALCDVISVSVVLPTSCNILSLWVQITGLFFPVKVNKVVVVRTYILSYISYIKRYILSYMIRYSTFSRKIEYVTNINQTNVRMYKYIIHWRSISAHFFLSMYYAVRILEPLVQGKRTKNKITFLYSFFIRTMPHIINKNTHK